MTFAIVRMAKLKTAGNIRASLEHTYRERDTLNADAARAGENRHQFTTADEAEATLKARLPDKVRKNAVLAVEYLITARQDWDGWKDDRGDGYLKDALKWLQERHGAANVVWSEHHDEQAPHLVAYVVPLDERGRLNAAHFFDGREKLSKMQTDFAEQVGKKYGLERGVEGSKARHESVKDYYARVHKGVEAPIKNKDIRLPDPPFLLLTENQKREYAVKVGLSVYDAVEPSLRKAHAKATELSAMAQKLEDANKAIAALKKRLEAKNETIEMADAVIKGYKLALKGAVAQIPDDIRRKIEQMGGEQAYMNIGKTLAGREKAQKEAKQAAHQHEQVRSTPAREPSLSR